MARALHHPLTRLVPRSYVNKFTLHQGAALGISILLLAFILSIYRGARKYYIDKISRLDQCISEPPEIVVDFVPKMRFFPSLPRQEIQPFNHLHQRSSTYPPQSYVQPWHHQPGALNVKQSPEWRKPLGLGNEVLKTYELNSESCTVDTEQYKNNLPGSQDTIGEK